MGNIQNLQTMKVFFVNLVFILAATFTVSGQNHSLSLSGKWNFQIDREDAGIREQWFNKSLDDCINLPGSMPEKWKGDNVTVRTQWTGSLYDSSYYYNPYMEKYRIEGQVKLPFFLTPDKHYVGVAWYQKKVTIPSDWKGERISLFLERPHIETTVWVGQQKQGMQNSLCVPHIYDLSSAVKAGNTYLITIRDLPSFRDAAISSEYAWKFIESARHNELPSIGELRTLEKIRERRKTMKNGYGLLKQK